MKAITSPYAPEAIGVYSQAIQSGNWIFISGQIGLDPKTMQMVEGVSSQIKQIFANLQAILEEAGGKLNHIVKLTVYLRDLNHFSLLNEMMQQYFVKPYPARAVVEISRLPKEAFIEIEATAIMDN
jgi:reactive intermediate/imine deaminase